MAVLGARGRLGRHLVDRLAALGHETVGGSGSVPTDVAAVVAACPGDPRSVRAAVQLGVPYLDSDPLDAWARQATARAGSSPVVTGVGAVGSLGVRLARLAAEELTAPRAAQISHAIPRLLTAGQRRTFLAALASRGRVLFDSLPREEDFGATEHPAYFPRPTGPRRAMSFPSAEPLRLRRTRPDIVDVSAYGVFPGSLVVGLPALRATVRSQRLHGAAERGLAVLGAVRPTLGAAAGGGWAVVAEVTDGEATARAWAQGDDVHRATAVLLAIRLQRLLRTDGEDDDGHEPDDAAALDELGRLDGARWVVQPPRDQGHHPVARPGSPPGV